MSFHTYIYCYKFTWKGKGIGTAKTIFKKEKKMERISLPNCKTYYIVTGLTIGIGSSIGIQINRPE